MQIQNSFLSSYFTGFNASFSTQNTRESSQTAFQSNAQNENAAQKSSFFETNFFETNSQNSGASFALNGENTSQSAQGASESGVSSSESSNENTSENSQESANSTELTLSERNLISQLQATDTRVRAHEMAHQAAGGGLTGAASYTYERGPDNKMYAVAGEVPISMQKGSTPEQTIANARQIQAAAMAPADPSPQDFRVAASAMRMEMQARAEQVRIQAEENAKRLEENSQDSEASDSQGISNDENSGAQNENASNAHNDFSTLQAANNAYASFGRDDISTTITEQMNFNKAV